MFTTGAAYKPDRISAAHAVPVAQLQKGRGRYLEDNRPTAAVQRKQIKAIAERSAKPIQKKENKTGLPDNLKSGIENLSGHSMDDVKVHYNSAEPAQLNAHAYAQGSQIHVAPGQEKHLPHEAWHVVQQKQGRVKPTKQLKGKTNINDDIGLEKEADVMGGKALQAKSTGQALRVSYPVEPVAQRRVLIAIHDQAEENDTVILTNLQYALNYAGGPVNDFSGNADFSGMREGEDLMIIEHGAPGLMGENGENDQGYTAADIVRVLLGDGERRRAVPANIGGITILACNAGTDTAAGADTSLVAGVAAGLHEADLNIVVDGKRGLALTSPTTGERTVNPAHDDAYMDIQNQAVIDHGLNENEQGDLKKANTIITQWIAGLNMAELTPVQRNILRHVVADGVNLAAWKAGFDTAHLTIEQRAYLISEITAGFYRTLIQRSDAAEVLFPEFSGERYSLGRRSHTY